MSLTYSAKLEEVINLNLYRSLLRPRFQFFSSKEDQIEYDKYIRDLTDKRWAQFDVEMVMEVNVITDEAEYRMVVEGMDELLREEYERYGEQYVKPYIVYEEDDGWSW